jgi:hypothetical protein
MPITARQETVDIIHYTYTRSSGTPYAGPTLAFQMPGFASSPAPKYFSMLRDLFTNRAFTIAPVDSL